MVDVLETRFDFIKGGVGEAGSRILLQIFTLDAVKCHGYHMLLIYIAQLWCQKYLHLV